MQTRATAAAKRPAADAADAPAPAPAPAPAASPPPRKKARRTDPDPGTLRPRAAKPAVPRKRNAAKKLEHAVVKPEPARVVPAPASNARVKQEPALSDTQEPGAAVHSQSQAQPPSLQGAPVAADAKLEQTAPPPPTSGATTTPSPSDPSIPADEAVTLARYDPSSLNVVADYDVMLNQCNIAGGRNNNKMYKIQLLSKGKSFYVWTRWGRVGEPARVSQVKMFGPYRNLETAEKTFAKKYSDKTRNRWENRSDFQGVSGKYWPVQIDYGSKEESSTEYKVETKVPRKIEYLPCSLDPVTKELVEVIHDDQMMTAAMATFDIDVDRMPLGKLNTTQIMLGVQVLDEIKAALPHKGHDVLAQLSSRFYTTIPHSFGRRRPPVISSEQMLQMKYDMCDTLTDMESTKKKLDEEQDAIKKEDLFIPHPADSAYNSLRAKLALIDENSDEFKVIATYFTETKGQNSRSELLHVWRVDRENEEARHQQHLRIENRELLWHGTGIEVVAAILSNGLRIMPHSGGRVGKGLYLACEQSKSAGYTRGWKGRYACMFLVEAALGTQHEITCDDPSLRKPPDGYDSVLARGCQAPKVVDPIPIDGRPVKVPQGPPVPSGVASYFHQDEYLVYDESQVRLRYIITLKQ